MHSRLGIRSAYPLLYGVHAAIDAAKASGLRPVVGAELTMGPGSVFAFVRDALEADSGGTGLVCDVEGHANIVELSLPPAWIHGLRDISGYDDVGHVLRLTTDRHRNPDGVGRRIGFLGRAALLF